tara:strand:- start:23335 stop:26343 length:3009 start_codon:yes stop_codon:yes gene_type:complete
MSEPSSFLGSLKGIIVATALVAGVGAAGYYVAPKLFDKIQWRGGGEDLKDQQFRKEAYDTNGAPLTGPVSVGQIIQYVLYYARPTSGATGPATINDTLSAAQTYVPNSIVAPGWSVSTPEYLANHEIYSTSSIAPSSFVMPISAVSGTMGAPGGGGDGYEPVPVVTSTGVKVFAVNHHQPASNSPPIMCWYGASLQKCSPSYPKTASTLPELRATSDLVRVAVYDKKLYYASGRYPNVPLSTNNQSIEFGVACWDAELDLPCPFIPLPGAPTLATGTNPLANYLGINIDPYLAGVRADPLNPSHLLMYALGTIYCVDVSLPGAPSCAGWNNATVSPTNTSGRSTDMFVEEGGTRVFFSNTVPRLFCFNIADGSVCSGWPATGINGGLTGSTNLGAGITASGTMDAICVSQGFAWNSGFKCFDMATAAPVTRWPVAFLNGFSVFSAYHLPGTARMLFPDYIGDKSRCYDFATSAGCAGYAPYWNNAGVKNYGYAVDPIKPESCIYGMGHGGKLVRFDQNGAVAHAACVPETYKETYTLEGQYCFKKPDVASWTSVQINNRPPELTSGTIVLKDSAGTVIQTIIVNSSNVYALSLSALGLNSTVTMEFTPTYSGGTLPTTDYQIELTYSADIDPQICYQATVTECGAVSNDAVLQDDLGTFQARVDLGDTVGGDCGGTEEDSTCLDLRPSMLVGPGGSGILTLTLGGPPGFGPTLVTLEAVTGGIGIATPVQTFSTGQTQGSWALTGLVPGTVAKFKVSGVSVGGGSKPGADECCEGTVELTVPEVGVGTKSDEPDNPPPPPPPPHDPECDTRSTKLKGGVCECRYEGMSQKSVTACACPIGTKLVAGEGCVKPPLVCDKWSTKAKNGACACLYPDMKRLSPTMCDCGKSEILVEGVGCVVPKQTDKPSVTRKPDTPSATVPPVPVCGPGSEMVDGECMAQCVSPMTRDGSTKACACPDGTEAKDGTCKKKNNFFDDVLGNVHFGVGVGGGSKPRSSGGGAPID